MRGTSLRTRDVAAGAGGIFAVLAVLVGVPAALVAGVGWPLPPELPSFDAVTTAMRYGQIAPSTLLRSLAVVLWVIWGLAALSIALEVAAVARGTVARALPGLTAVQTAAARLVATVMLLSSLAGRAAAAGPEISPPIAPTPIELADASGDDIRPTHRPQRTAEARARFWTVQRRDSLWTIAERSLGDGHRWKEIAALNEGRAQPDGGQLRRGDTLIRPGWRLALPPGTGRSAQPDRVTVDRGDDLWSLSVEHLDDGERWTEIYARNRGRTQDDGRRLNDPDLIRPGWVLRLPPHDPSPDTRDTDAVPPPDPSPSTRDTDAAPSADPSPSTRDTDAVPSPDPSPGTRDTDAAPPRDAETATKRDERAGGVRRPDDMPPSDAPADDAARPRGHAGPLPTPERGRTAEGVEAAAPDEAPTELPPPVTPSTMRLRTATPAPTPMASVTPLPTTAGPPTPTRRPGAGVVVLGAAAVLSAGLVGLIARRRRHWFQRRAAGAVLDPVEPEAAELERWLRSMADHDLHERLDRVLRVLTEHFAEHGVAPAVSGIELGEQVTLRLATNDADPPPSVACSDDGSRWVLAPELEMAPAAEQRYLPAVVSCGRLADGSLLLLNLLETGVLGIAGAPTETADAVTSWTAELAAGGASGGVEIVVLGVHHPMVERLPRVTVVDAADQALARVRRVIDGADGFADRIVVVSGESVDTELDALMAACEHPRVAVVLPGPQRVGTCLEISDTRVRLLPDGAWFAAPEWLSPQDWDRFGDLLRQPDRSHVQVPATSPLLAIDALDRIGPTIDLDGEPDDSDRIEIGVLGPLTIDGRPGDVGAETTPLLTYLAVHPTGDDPIALASTLWPAHTDRAARLGRAADAIAEMLDSRADRPALVHTDDGRLELSAAVTTDLRTLRDQLRQLDAQPLAVQARRMYTALALVRGEPFPAGADWAHADGTAVHTLGLIVDTAHRLAMQSLTVGDVERADWAVSAGLRAAPTCELLFRDRMRIADARGDHAAIDVAMHELRSRVEADDGWVAPETIALHEQLCDNTVEPDGRQQDAS